MVPLTYSSHMPQRTLGHNSRTSSAMGRLVGVILLGVMALFYIAQANDAASKRVEAQAKNDTISTLTIQQSQLQLEAERLQSLSNVSQSSGQLQLQPVDSVEHLAGQ